MAENPEGSGDFDPADDADVDEAVETDEDADSETDPTDGTETDADRESADSTAPGGDEAVDEGTEETDAAEADVDDAVAEDGVTADDADAETDAAETADSDVADPEDESGGVDDGDEETDIDAAVDDAFEVDRGRDDDEPSDIGYDSIPAGEETEGPEPDDPADHYEFTLDSDSGMEYRESTPEEPEPEPELDEEETGSPVLGEGVLDGADAEAEAADEGLFGEGPETDEEMPLAEHLEEMVGRLGVVLFIGGAITLTLFPGSDVVNAVLGTDYLTSVDVINYLWNAHIPGAPELPDRRPRLYGPLELLLTELKVAALAGFIAGLPILVYQTYRFMRPGLYAHERRYYLAAIPTSLILATVGVLFSHFVVLPIIFQYFTAYTTGTAVVAFGLRETFNLILLLMGYNALIFQIPLFIMLAIMMGLTTRTWMEDRRLLFWGAFAGIAFLINPDPTGMTPIIIVVTMITLFEGTLLLLRWTGN